jgi:hypothetical protein
MIFRYRYVPYGTTFVPGEGLRESVTDDPDDAARLHENEVAVDVGGACMVCAQSPLNVIDHHFSSGGNALPAATCAVLAHASELRGRFTAKAYPVAWLVAHREADFDAYAGMYVARWLLEAEAGGGSSAGVRIDAAIDWLSPPSALLSGPERWAVLLASYAAHVDTARRMAAPRDRALHSVLYAALVRGRPYAAPDSGAVELFDEARAHIERGLDPRYDAVLDAAGTFAPEFSMLAAESRAYERDVRRGRRTMVFVPAPGEPFERAFAALSAEPLLDERGALRPVQLSTMDARRRLFDGIYLRDPESLLFKEWARLDVDNSPQRRGFTFTFVAYSRERPGGDVNATSYLISLDPERAGDATLWTVWCRLEAAEVAALVRQRGQNGRAPAALPRTHYEQRAGTWAAYFTDPWFEAPHLGATLVATPNAGTVIGAPGAASDCLDDPIAAIVRAELEAAVYDGDLWTRDVPGGHDAESTREHAFDLRDSIAITPAAEGQFRFAKVPLRADVDLGFDVLAGQIAIGLWAALHGESVRPGLAVPHDRLFRHGDVLGVWSRRGVAIAYTPAAAPKATLLAGLFDDIVACARDIDELVIALQTDAVRADRGGRARTVARVEQSESIMRRMADVRHRLILPEAELLGNFVDGIGLDDLLATLRDLSQGNKVDEQNERIAEHMGTIADVQSKVEWLELLFVGIYAIEVAEIISNHAVNCHVRLLVTLLIATVLTGAATFFLQPWTRPGSERGRWLLGLFIVMLVGGAILGFADWSGRLNGGGIFRSAC